jgi:tetratricopeptide (TPR) repeat protein
VFLKTKKLTTRLSFISQSFFARALLLLSMAFLSFSCATTSNPRVAGPVEESEARRSLQNAMVYVNDGLYHSAVPRLFATVTAYPETSSGLEARYYLVKSYSEIGSPRAAIETAEEYLRSAPDGPRADELRQWVSRIQRDNEVRFPSVEALNQEIGVLEQRIAQEPNSKSLHLEYADRLWQRGRYADAGRVYVDAYNRWPEVGQETVFQRRVDYRAANDFVVLSPSEIQRRDVAANPVQIINTHGYESGRDERTRTRNRYVVTGQALNRSDDIIYGIDVIVSIRGFGSEIYDAAQYRIDRLFPKESRAFAVTFWNFPSTSQINSYEIEVYYQR